MSASYNYSTYYMCIFFHKYNLYLFMEAVYIKGKKYPYQIINLN